MHIQQHVYIQKLKFFYMYLSININTILIKLDQLEIITYY